jgi:hypothetical protein
MSEPPKFDYGEGKTRDQEAQDSMFIAALGCASAIVVLVAMTIALLWWLL